MFGTFTFPVKNIKNGFVNRRNMGSGPGLVQQATPGGLDGARAERTEWRSTSATRPLLLPLQGPGGASAVLCTLASLGEPERRAGNPHGRACICTGPATGQLTGLTKWWGSSDRSFEGPCKDRTPTRCPSSICYMLANLKQARRTPSGPPALQNTEKGPGQSAI